jgi:predicted Fe-S protein YdhL (DUF1289 family)
LNEIDNIEQVPCTRNCCLNDDDVCIGCFRSAAEITQWNEASDNERFIILQNARQRRQAQRNCTAPDAAIYLSCLEKQ